jgi:3-oxo-5-alpha-steroid 4-dehydrogenase 1
LFLDSLSISILDFSRKKSAYVVKYRFSFYLYEMNISLNTINTISYLWCGLALITFISLLFIHAPYGRHIRKGWGILIDNKLGWIVMEMVSPIVLSYFFWTGLGGKNTLLIFVYSLWVLHYIYRSIIFPLMINTSSKKIPLSIALMAIFFNSINGFTNGTYLGNYAIHIDHNWINSCRFIFGFLLFITGFAIHYTSDRILIGLRKSSNEGYLIPFGFLYKYISCPNYLGEIIQWIGFAILTWSPTGLVFALWTFANLFPRALSNHKWYLENFTNYPSDRKAIVPFVV